MQVYVADDHVYQELEPMNEMLVKKGGVKMHPEPKFMICGLEPGEEYIMKLRVEMVDELRYMYQVDQWVPVASANRNAKLCKFSRSESRKEKGSLWNSIIVQFEKLRITREFSEIRQHVIYVEPNHKYIPIVSIVNASTGISFDFRFDQLQFVAVKSFQSIPIRHAKRNPRNFSLLGSNVSKIEEPENQKPKSLMDTKLIPNDSYQMYQFYPYPYGYSTGVVETSAPYNPYQYDYFLCYPQIPYQMHQLPYSLPVHSNQTQYLQPENEQTYYSDQEEYVPEYGWNPILVPGAKNEIVAYNHFAFHHEIWAPQEMELEKLYFLTEQNYHPLEMY